MAIAKNSYGLGGRGPLVTFSQTSGAPAAQTCSTDGLQAYRVLFATVDYSGAATGAVTYTLNSVLGTAYDALLESDAAAAVSTFLPAFTLILAPGDVLDVLAATGGGTDTSSAVIYCEGL